MSYWETLTWTTIGAGFAIIAAATIYMLYDTVGRTTMLYMLGTVAGLVAVCAIVAVPIWLLT